MSRRGRTTTTEPWLSSIVIIAVLFPHLIWLDLAGDKTDQNVPFAR